MKQEQYFLMRDRKGVGPADEGRTVRSRGESCSQGALNE